MAHIYKIVNDINDKIYIGKTEQSLEKRFKEHCRDAKRKRYEKRPLYNAMNKYGVEHFSIELIEETDRPEEREMYWIEYYDTYHYGYNATLGGDGSKYLQLNEQEICEYYSTHSLKQTTEHFNHDILTIKKVLLKNNITIKSAGESLRKRVAKIDIKTNEILEIYDSQSEADRLNGNSHHIAEACNGKRKTCQGYKWKYIDE